MPDSEKHKFWFEPLDKKKHDRAAFCCEQESLNIYLKERAGQELEKRVAAVYVLTADGKTIAGFYTLSSYSIDAGELPDEVAKKLRVPKYDRLPATLLGRLARSTKFKGMGIGELLLFDALRNSLVNSRKVASLAVVVDAIDEKAHGFYRDYGFLDLPDHASRLFIPMKTIAQMFAGREPEP